MYVGWCLILWFVCVWPWLLNIFLHWNPHKGTDSVFRNSVFNPPFNLGTSYVYALNEPQFTDWLMINAVFSTCWLDLIVLCIVLYILEGMNIVTSQPKHVKTNWAHMRPRPSKTSNCGLPASAQLKSRPPHFQTQTWNWNPFIDYPCSQISDISYQNHLPIRPTYQRHHKDPPSRPA